MINSVIAVVFCWCLALVAAPPPSSSSTGPAEYTAAGQLKLPEHYREWVFLSSGVGMTYGPSSTAGGDAHPAFDNVFVDPEAYRAFLATGHWPSRAVFVLEVRNSESHGSINNGGHFQTERLGLEAEVKDDSSPSGRWTFYAFSGPSGGLAVSARPIARTAACYSCHAKNAAVENTFVQFYPVLFNVAVKNQTLNPAFSAAHPH